MKKANIITRNDLTSNIFCGVTKHFRASTGVNFVLFQTRQEKLASSGACGTSRIDEALKELVSKIDFLTVEVKKEIIKKASSGRYSSIWSGLTQDGLELLAKDLGFSGVDLRDAQYNPTNLKSKDLQVFKFF